MKNNPFPSRVNNLSIKTLKFRRYGGKGKKIFHRHPMGDYLEVFSHDSSGLAATLISERFPVEAQGRYKLSMEIKTENLLPITARMTAHAYLYFNDKNGNPGGWFPSVDYNPNELPIPIQSPYLAPTNTDWIKVTQEIRCPTTAGDAIICIVYAGFGNWKDGHPRTSGRAKGRLMIRNVKLTPSEFDSILPSTIHISDSKFQTAINIATNSIHNSSIQGWFVVSDGYTISGNIVPDLSFGLFGVRRLGHLYYMDLMKAKWNRLASELTPEGKLTSQRVMGQVFFVIGVDEIFSFTGDQAFLKQFLPLADLSLEYIASKADENGLARLVNSGEWRIGEGTDWVDWYPVRMEGKTLMFHLWYIYALRRMANLHEEFPSVPSQKLPVPHVVELYRKRADQIVESIRRYYWQKDHFIPNIDYQGKPVDQIWCDDQIWAIKWKIATEDQTKAIWEWINANPHKYEGVPMTWAAFAGHKNRKSDVFGYKNIPWHGDQSWYGRHGVGDVLARYQCGNATRALELLQRITEIYNRDKNIYEAFDMDGNVVKGTDGWGNYTEHAGGYIWSILEGPFGVNFESDSQAVASITLRFPATWTSSEAIFYLRGSKIKINYTNSKDHILTITGEGKDMIIRINFPDGTIKLIKISAEKPEIIHIK